MANWCYTTYVIEGTEKEIGVLYDVIEDGLIRGCSKKQQLNHILWENERCVNYLFRYLKVKNCIDDRGFIQNIRHLENGEQSLICMNGYCAWDAITDAWVEIVGRYAPSAKFYYWGEEMHADGCYTNDTKKKYFPADFIVWGNPEAPFGKILYKGTAPRTNEDQYGDCFGYWTLPELKPVLREILKQPRAHMDELLEICRRKLPKVNIDKVNRKLLDEYGRR